MTSKQRAYLKGLASNMDPIVHVGKASASAEVVTSVQEALEARELIKVKLLKNSDENIKTLANDVAQKLNAECVQVIGGVFVLYRRSNKKGINHIEF